MFNYSFFARVQNETYAIQSFQFLELGFWNCF